MFSQIQSGALTGGLRQIDATPFAGGTSKAAPHGTPAVHVTATNMPWNQTIGVGSSIFPGFNATFTGTNPVPVNVMLNGQACSVV